MRTTLLTLLGAFTGLVSLLGMVRLISGGFGGHVSALAWGAIALAMVPWLVYCAWRARRGRLGDRAAAVVLALDLLGSALVWLATAGPVVALACSLAAFTVIWVSDWPVHGRPAAPRVVRLEDLRDRD